MKYTKGEWRVRKAPTNHEVISTLAIMGESDDGVVADVYSCYTGLSEANAYLIAKSPRMAELLSRLLTISFSTEDENYEELSPILEEAQEILQTLA